MPLFASLSLKESEKILPLHLGIYSGKCLNTFILNIFKIKGSKFEFGRSYSNFLKALCKKKKKSSFAKSTKNVELCIIHTVPFCPLLLTLFTLNVVVILVSTRQLIPSALPIHSHSLWVVLAHLCQHHQ